MNATQRICATALLCLVHQVGPAAGEDFHFIDTNFPNASPLDWDVDSEGTVRVHLRYDNERDSRNRASGHWHFRIEAKAGANVKLTLDRFANIWNGSPSLPVGEKTITFISQDGRTWKSLKCDFDKASSRVSFAVTIPDSGQLFVARLPPYTVANLEKLLSDIQGHPAVKISRIGKTVQGRPLEIVQVGRERAPFRIFLRARAHPWEPGGSWVADGMIRHLTSLDASSANKYFERFCLYVMPMANKDGVALGRTRFNVKGKDLNRDWNVAADEASCPENAALERWLVAMLEAGQRPHLALEMHNDRNGRLHISRPPHVHHDAYLERMQRLETLLRNRTWFREGST